MSEAPERPLVPEMARRAEAFNRSGLGAPPELGLEGLMRLESGPWCMSFLSCPMYLDVADGSLLSFLLSCESINKRHIAVSSYMGNVSCGKSRIIPATAVIPSRLRICARRGTGNESCLQG